MRKTYRRYVGKREPTPSLVLIFTEGEKTEPYYFDSFKLNAMRIKTIGLGMNTVSLIRKVDRQVNDEIRKYAKEFAETEQNIDYQVWCVFDKDAFTDSQFNSAIRMAEKRGYSVAFSNESFELWYVLHYKPVRTGHTRDEYCDMLSQLLNQTYEKKAKDMYQRLGDKQSIAIKNANSLIKNYPNGLTPAKMNPCTSVHQLVIYLNQYLRK